MFNLAISYLTTSNLLWFIDLRFLMQHCSLQYRTLLSPPGTSTTEHWFRFGPATSFFLELLPIALCPSPVAYWTPPNLGDSSFSVLSFCFFSCCSWGSQGKNAEEVCHSLLQWITFCQNSPPWPIHLGWSDISSVQFSSVAQSCLTLCDPMNGSTPGLPVPHQLMESTQTHVHWFGDTMQPSHPVIPFSSCP